MLRRHQAPRDGDEKGQALVEVAVAFPTLLLVALALVQFALYVQAESVVTGAVQDGARVAAAEGSSLGDGVQRTQAILRAGLGQNASGVTVQGTMGSGTVMIEAQGHLHLIIPWIGGGSLPLRARSLVSREQFIAPPGG